VRSLRNNKNTNIIMKIADFVYLSLFSRENVKLSLCRVGLGSKNISIPSKVKLHNKFNLSRSNN
jgi:hypothetical protein